MSGQSLVLRRLVKASAVVLGAGLLVTGCSPVKFGAAAITGNQRITIATLTTEVTNLSQAVKQYPGTIQMSSAQETQETLTWLVRFQINDELARQAGITVTPAQAEAALAEIYAAAKSSAEAQGLSNVTLNLILAANGIPPNLAAEVGQYQAIQNQFVRQVNGGTIPTTTSAQTATTAKLQHAQCVAAKSLTIQINPQFGQLNYTQYQVVSAPNPVAASSGTREADSIAVWADAGLLIVLVTSPRVAPGLLSWPAWQALRSASSVLVSAGHPQLPALDEAGIGYRVVDDSAVESLAAAGDVVWLPEPGAEPPVPAGAQLLHGSADLPGAHLLDLVATMDRLRVECPWDARQTHASLAPHLLEEPYEALEALESGDEQAFCEELGDVLLQVVFHARIAAEREDGTSFTVDDVADGIVAKLVRRHPHVFADVTVSGAEDVKRNWDEIKREEKRALALRRGDAADGPAAPSALDGVPFGQPALALAAQLQRRAARAGVPEELARLDGDAGGAESGDPGEDIGRELFRLVVKAREAGRDPEMELRAAARRYRDLVRAWERS